MTKLEEEFAKAFVNKGGSAKEMRYINAKVAAEVAKKYIEKAFVDGYYAIAGPPLTEEELAGGQLPAQICWNRWLKENGIID